MASSRRVSAKVFAALVCAGACGGALPGGTANSVDGGTGGSGGSASGATGDASSGGVSAVDASVPLDALAGAGTGGESACDTPPAACACDSQVSECQPALMNVCLGQHCPPTLDDAMLVANWPLDSATATLPGRVDGSYTECASGSRGFSIARDARLNGGFAFDDSGRLASWYTYTSGSCAELVCGAFTSKASFPCAGCRMISDPQPAGTLLIPRGTRNGPVPNCEIDDNGRWSMPRLAPAN